jgi:spermidine synthase
MTRQIVDSDGALTLARSGTEWEILWEGTFLMSSACRASERALGELASGRTLVGGLGMGFTVRAALDAGAARVDVAEISASVLRWNLGHLATCAGSPLDDERVFVQVADVATRVRAAAPATWDCILYDVDNGPSWTARPQNDALYGDDALTQIKRVLAPGGCFAVWSAQREPAFAARLASHFTDVAERAIPVEVGGRPSEDYLYVVSCKDRP